MECKSVQRIRLRTILHISRNWMPYLCHMGADLVLAPRDKFDSQQRVLIARGNHCVVCHRLAWNRCVPVLTIVYTARVLRSARLQRLICRSDNAVRPLDQHGLNCAADRLVWLEFFILASCYLTFDERKIGPPH